MKTVFAIIMLIIFISCKSSERDFFKNLNSNSVFIDSFSLYNLKGFGIEVNPFMKNGHKYYRFNNYNNSILHNGFFRHENGKIFFLPESCKEEVVFADTLFWDTTLSISSKRVENENNTIYTVEIDNKQNKSDSILVVKLIVSNVLKKSQTLIFDIYKGWIIKKITLVNCNNDTIVIEFLPIEKVYFKYFNPDIICL